MIRSGLSALTAGEIRPDGNPDEGAVPTRLRRDSHPTIFWFSVVSLIALGVGATVFSIILCAGMVNFS